MVEPSTRVVVDADDSEAPTGANYERIRGRQLFATARYLLRLHPIKRAAAVALLEALAHLGIILVGHG